jgi:hypothetical protein
MPLRNRRRKAQELRDELDRVERSPYPSAYCKAQARQRVEQLAERGRPDVTTLIQFDQDVGWPLQRVQSEVFAEQRAIGFSQLVDPVALLAWLDPQRLIARLDAEIDSKADDKVALSHEARQTKAAELQTALLGIERQEAELIWRAMDERLPVEFRADIAPAAILGVALQTAPVVNRHGTSAAHGYDIMGWLR